MYRQCPTAVIAAREDEALTHGQVLYGLIKPTKDMDMVESTAAMVNVIPKKRIYRMEEPEEIDLFLKELMKRPLVIQPSAYIGRGIAAIGCTLCTAEERWVLLINQVHPKIRGRIQMGIDTAKSKMENGEPFIIKLTFNEYLKRVYLDHLTRTALDARFTFIDFEDAEIVIRYPGDRYHRSLSWEMKTPEIVLSFDDLLPSEMTRRTVGAAQSEWNNPALRVIMPDEMCTYLPGWEFEMVDPLAGVASPDDVELQDEAVGGVELPPETAPSGRVLGRAQRKGKAVAETHHVPVELHVPEPNGPQMLHRSSNPASPVSPGRGRNLSPSPPPYEDLHRDPYRNEHTYEQTRVHNSQLHTTRDSPYEEMNMHRQKYSSYDTPPSYNSVSHIAPRTPTSPRQHTPTQQSAYSPNSLHTPRSPHLPRTPKSPNSPRTPYSPHTPSTPYSPASSTDRYNTDYTGTQSSRKTYLTDDSENGAQTQTRQYSGHKYDSNFNKSAEMDRYGDSYNPQDRYADKSFQPVPSPRGNFPQTHRPTVSPRGLHHHQGSGRSDTSASDSGFGESEESRQRHNNRYNGNIDSSTTPTKTPYYNHAYQHSPDSADKNFSQMQARQGHDGYRKQEFYSDDRYGHELQKWRQNINHLEEACDVPQSDFRGTQLRMNSNSEEPMEESFI